MFRFIANSAILSLASLLQLTPFLMLSGMKPNLALVLIIIFSVFEADWVYRAFWILLPALLLKSAPGIDTGTLVFMASAVIACLFMDHLPWRKEINAAGALMLGTVIGAMPAFSFERVFIELLYNFSVGIIVFVTYRMFNAPRLYKPENKLR